MMSRGSLNRPECPSGDPSREIGGWGRVKWHVLKCEHLWNEKKETPHPHDDIANQSDQEQSADGHITPRHHQR